MYLPRHYKVDRKRATNFTPFILLALVVLLGFGFFKKRKEIQLLFAGNIPQKYAKTENKIIETLANGKLEKELASEFTSISQSYLQVEPLNPSSHHAVAKSFYYELIASGFDFSLKRLMSFVLESPNSDKELEMYYTHLNSMYRNALRAKIFSDEFREKQSNILLILLFETFEARKNPSFILEELGRIEYDKISPDLRSVYLWLSFIASVNSGDMEALELMNERNTNLQDGLQMKISEREILFLKGVSSYNKKEFVKSLELLREAKGSIDDFITIQAIKLEANIFHQQNLHEKAITILENLYEATGRKDETIKEKISQIMLTKPGLRSRLP